jgi:hypothetical protein
LAVGGPGTLSHAERDACFVLADLVPIAVPAPRDRRTWIPVGARQLFLPALHQAGDGAVAEALLQ